VLSGFIRINRYTSLILRLPKPLVTPNGSSASGVILLLGYTFSSGDAYVPTAVLFKYAGGAFRAYFQNGGGMNYDMSNCTEYVIAANAETNIGGILTATDSGDKVEVNVISEGGLTYTYIYFK
jgi:hypothetical protein